MAHRGDRSGTSPVVWKRIYGKQMITWMRIHPVAATHQKLLLSCSGLARSGDARALEHRMQQHVAASGDVLGLGVLDLVVADAVACTG